MPPPRPRRSGAPSRPRLAGLFLVALFACAPALPAAEKVAFHLDWFPGPQFAGLYVAEAGGYYRDAGLAVAFVPFAYGAKSAAAIAASDATALGCIEGYILLQKRAQGADLRALAATLQESPAGYLSLATHPVRSARDFVGRTIGVHHYGDPLYRWFLHRAGVPESAATMIFVGDDLAPLLRGEIAAMQGYATEEFVRLQARVGGQARFVSFRELGFDAYSEILYTTPGQLAAHGPAIRAFVAATRRGWSEAFAHPEATLRVLRSRMGDKFDPALTAAALAALQPLVLGDSGQPFAPMRAAKWRALESACVEMGFAREAEPPERFLAEPTP